MLAGNVYTRFAETDVLITDAVTGELKKKVSRVQADSRCSPVCVSLTRFGSSVVLAGGVPHLLQVADDRAQDHQDL